MKPETTRTFEFTRNGIFFDSECKPIICVAAMQKVLGVKDVEKNVCITGSLHRGKGKGWVLVKANAENAVITVKGKTYEMHYDLERFLVYLGVQNKRFYVKLEK